MIRRSSHWSLGAGKFQVWYTFDAEDHGIPGLSSLTTPSFYSDAEEPRLRRMKYVGFKLDDRDVDLFFWVTPDGKVTACEGGEVLRAAGGKIG